MAANWYFGGKNPLEGYQPNPTFGGFNLGGVQNEPVPPIRSSVATPNPARAAAGVSGQPAGGMSVGQTDEGGGTSLGTPEGNANVTGLNASLIGSGLGAATAFAGFPSLGANVIAPAIGGIPGMIAGLLSNLGVGAAKSAALNAGFPSNMTDTFGNPVTYTGNGPFGLPTGKLVYGNSPDLSDPLGVPDVSPNMGGLFSGNGGFTTATTGDVDAGFSGSGAGGRYGFNAPGVRNPFAPYFTDPQTSPRISGPDPDLTPAPIGVPGAPTGLPSEGITSDGVTSEGTPSGMGPIGDPTGGEPGAGPPSGPVGSVGIVGFGDISDATAAAVSGDAGVSGGAPGGSAGAPAGGGDSGNAGDFKRGGRIQPVRRRPDPRKLSSMLKRGAKVQTGDDDDETDDVGVRLTKGETVVNKPASDKHAKTLAAWNAAGNRAAGGFTVGRPRDQRR